METIAQRPGLVTDMKQRMADILFSISWREFAHTYFGKSSSWFYRKMDGIDGKGRDGGFTPTETAQMRDALIDLSERIRRVADELGEATL